MTVENRTVKIELNNREIAALKLMAAFFGAKSLDEIQAAVPALADRQTIADASKLATSVEELL